MPSDADVAYARERFGSDVVIWIVTVRADGQPQASPVWFLWDGEDFWIWSMPGSRKVPNVRRNPRVALHLEGDRAGSDIVTLEATAEIVEDRPLTDVPEYVEKYRQLVADLDYGVDEFAQAYTVCLRVRPGRLRVFRN